MLTDLFFSSSPWVLPVVMLLVLTLAIELPYRFLQLAVEAAGRHVNAFSVVQTGLVTLASFVLGLSFAQASERYDARRELVVKEANAIGTTWLRADQLSAKDRDRFRRILTSYTAARLDAYQTPRNPTLYEQTLQQSDRNQSQLWQIVSTAMQADRTNLGLSLLMQTLNDTIDVSAEQLQALTTHVPTAVVTLTLVLVSLSALSVGLRFALERARPPVLSAVYVFAFVVVITMMIDYDRPQAGFVKINLNPITMQLAAMQSEMPNR
jgi:hypothetical protein